MPAFAPITITVSSPYDAEPGEAELAVVGELDLSTTRLLRDAAHATLSAHDAVRLDLSGVSFCDTAGVRCVLDLISADKLSSILLSSQIARLVNLLNDVAMLPVGAPGGLGAAA